MGLPWVTIDELDEAGFPAGATISSDHVVFFDTTLRDGEQSPGCSMTTQEKLTMAHALEDLGVDIVEAGFAMASEGDFAAISTITQAIRKPRIASLSAPTVSMLCNIRCFRLGRCSRRRASVPLRSRLGISNQWPTGCRHWSGTLSV